MAFTRWLRHKVNGSVYPHTDALAKNKHMEPFDPATGKAFEDVAPAALPLPPGAEQAEKQQNAAPPTDGLDDLQKDDLMTFAEMNAIAGFDRRWNADRLRTFIREEVAKRATGVEAV